MRSDSQVRRLGGLRGALLNAIVEGPPSWPGERWFHRDLDSLSRGELLAERDNIRLRLRLSSLQEQECWPCTWFSDRLQRIEQLLRPVQAWPRGARA